MILFAVGCSYHNTPVAMRERLAFSGEGLDRALDAVTVRFGCEAVILSTCNRVELYLAQALDRPLSPEELLTDGAATDFLAGFHGIAAAELQPHLYCRQQGEAVLHLFRVAASLDSMLIGEGQIAGQVKTAYEKARERSSAGPLLHSLFQHARLVARRVRTETGIARGHVSVSGAAVDYVRQVFDHFGDKTVLVIGAGKMGELTLKHLQSLKPRRIVVTNRSPEKAAAVAAGCGGDAVAWDRLDDLLATADIILSTTGAPEPIVSRERWLRATTNRLRELPGAGTAVIIDIAVPRDFDPLIHDGDRTCLFNIDDLKRVREATLADRRQHLAPAEAIVDHEARKFLIEWARRSVGPVIARLQESFEAERQPVVRDLLAKLNGRLTDADCKHIEGAFKLLQNRFLHKPISALSEETKTGAATHSGHTLLDALRKLFRLGE
jgi:glutamyl-tRNA reductase